MATDASHDKSSFPLTIFMIVDSIQIGGTETHVLSVTKQLIAKGHRVIVGTSGGPYLDAFKEAGIEIQHLPFVSDDPLRQELTDLLHQVRKIIVEEGVDIIHAHLIGGMKIATYIAEETGLPFVMTIHGLYYPISQLQRYLYSCDHVIAVSHPVAKWLQERLGHSRKRITIIQNGIDTTTFSPGERDNEFRRELSISPDETLILSLGRIAWGKTRVIAVTMESLLQLKNNDKVHLAVVGTGPDMPLVHAIASMVNRQLERDIVRFLGPQQKGLANMYRAADVVIGSARVALEAMSCGRPLIAAGNAGYFGLLTEDNLQEAWKVYFGDHSGLGPANSARVVEDLSRVFDHPEDLDKIGTVYRDWIQENFNIQSITERIEDVYRSIINRTSSRAPIEIEQEDATSTLSPNHEVPQVTSSNVTDTTAYSTDSRPSDDKSELDAVASIIDQGDKDSQSPPLISVVVPAYNPGDFLDACLEALFKQTYEPLEIIVVDDASTDHTPKIVDKWTKKSNNGRTVVYHRLPANVGFAHAVSIGYFLSSGAYIANHDADDISHPERIERQYNFLLAEEQCSLVGTNYEVFIDSLENRKKTFLVKYGDSIDAAYREGKHCVCSGSLLFERRVLERIGGMTSFAKGAEDFEFIARAITQGFKVDNIKKPLYYYRSHENQRSRDYYSKRQQLSDSVSKSKP